MYLSAIKQMEHFAREQEDIVSLSQGIPFSDSDQIIRDAVYQAIRENFVDKYSDPQGIFHLRERISDRLKKEGMIFSPEEILVTSGAVEAMMSTLLALTSPGDEVLVPTPTYAAFFRACEIARLRVSPIPLNEQSGWLLNLDLLKKSVSKKMRAIILCNPNNPTGTVYKKNDLIAIATLAEQYGIYLILDEVYSRMLYTSTPFYTPATDKRFKQYIIRIESFSKTFSLTGWRVGFLHSHRKNIERILPIHDSLVNCAPVVSQFAAIAALSLSSDSLQKKMEMYTKQRTLMGSYLQQLTSYISFHEPEGAYFYFPKLRRDADSLSFCLDVLKRVNLAVVPGSDFGAGGERHFRLCFGRKESDIRQGMERLVQYFNS